jgi:fructose-1,6-bisphosphatase I
LSSIQLACKVISNACSKAGIFKLYGLDGSSNTSGDAVKKLDVFANDIFINSLMFSDRVSIMVSEENEDPIYNPNCIGKYFVAFDPLDGSSNIDANVSIGTIFGIWMNPDADNPTKISNVLQPGHKLVAAGYAMYGAASMIVLSTGDGVNGFTLDPSLGEYLLTHENIRCPKKGSIYSINEGNASTWDATTTQYVSNCKSNAHGKKPKSARYVGSMVADVHRTLLYGGIFMYPGSKSSPQGKLRLMYEGAPMAFLLEQAGGKATTGTERILDLTPKSLHEPRPIFLGSADDVDEICLLYKAANQK